MEEANVFHKRVTDTSELPKPIPYQNLWKISSKYFNNDWIKNSKNLIDYND